MDRFSTRLAASLIEDRHRDAGASRRQAAAEALLRSQATTVEPVRRIKWPIRLRVGAGREEARRYGM